MSHTKRDARKLDVVVRDIQNENEETPKICEPLDKMDTYDTMRMFYVALSRAKNLAVLSWPKGARVFKNFKNYLEISTYPDIDSFDIESIPEYKPENDKLAHVYSYTSDFYHMNSVQETIWFFINMDSFLHEVKQCSLVL